jgi:uncharacterized protein (DUF433 family)
MTMSQLQQISHIEMRPGVHGERAFIVGHRIRVQDIVLWDEEGLTPDEIVARAPSITLADVHAALAYYYDHREDVDRQIREDNSFAAAMEQSQSLSSKRQDR